MFLFIDKTKDGDINLATDLHITFKWGVTVQEQVVKKKKKHRKPCER